jgi:hypothetical protein
LDFKFNPHIEEYIKICTNSQIMAGFEIDVLMQIANKGGSKAKLQSETFF